MSVTDNYFQTLLDLASLLTIFQYFQFQGRIYEGGQLRRLFSSSYPEELCWFRPAAFEYVIGMTAEYTYVLKWATI